MALAALCFLAGNASLFGGPESSGQAPLTPTPQIAGEMRRVMREGHLAGVLDLRTIRSHVGLYGVGPVEYLKGELTIFDGVSYKSTVTADRRIHVEKTFEAKAPFFVYANVTNWVEAPLPETVLSLKDLETFLDRATTNHSRPFAFKVKADIASAEIHVLNLPEGGSVHSHEEGHRGQLLSAIEPGAVDLVGFFSTEHQGIFTHHDSYIHVHLLTEDRAQIGHLNSVTFKPGSARLFLPKDDRQSGAAASL